MRHAANQCAGKVAYPSKALCNHAVAALNKERGPKVRTYKCQTCKKYHFGHESKSRLIKPKPKKVIYNHTPQIHKINPERYIK